MIIQIRVDDRLIHGQIAVVWSKHFATNHLVVANDQAAKNEVQQMTLKMATPNGVKVLIRSVDDAIKVFNNPKSETVKMFVLTNSIQVESINVANVGRFEAASEKKQLNADVGCTPKELEALKEIAKLDMETIHWVIPTNPKISVKKLLENN